jgi:hypothetical protein
MKVEQMLSDFIESSCVAIMPTNSVSEHPVAYIKSYIKNTPLVQK